MLTDGNKEKEGFKIWKMSSLAWFSSVGFPVAGRWQEFLQKAELFASHDSSVPR
jgi:hypothetical protein